MSTLHRGSRGPEVEAVQRKLNCLGPTRLPRLTVDRDYGILTMARVMEFQSQQGLTTDGRVGTDTNRSLNGTGTNCTNAATPTGRCIVVDLIFNRLTAYLNGAVQVRAQ